MPSLSHVVAAKCLLPFLSAMNSSEDWSARESVPSTRSSYNRYKNRNGTHEPRSAKAKIKPPHEYLSVHYDDLPKRRGAIRLLNLYSSSSNSPQIEGELITPQEHSGDNIVDGIVRIP